MFPQDYAFSLFFLFSLTPTTNRAIPAVTITAAPILPVAGNIVFLLFITTFTSPAAVNESASTVIVTGLFNKL